MNPEGKSAVTVAVRGGTFSVPPNGRVERRYRAGTVEIRVGDDDLELDLPAKQARVVAVDGPACFVIDGSRVTGRVLEAPADPSVGRCLEVTH